MPSMSSHYRARVSGAGYQTGKLTWLVCRLTTAVGSTRKYLRPLVFLYFNRKLYKIHCSLFSYYFILYSFMKITNFYLFFIVTRSKLRRFQVANRTHKPEPYSADRARRRKWVRFMSRSDCAVSSMARVRSLSSAGPPPVDYDVLIPRIQNSLARVHSARLQVESLMSHSNNGTPTSADRSSFLSSGRASYSSEMQSFLLPLHVHIQEVLTAFDSLELQREPPPTVAGVLKKLRNDVIKEQV